MPLFGRLLLSRFFLAEVAASVTTRQAILAGLAALFFMNCAFFGVVGASIDEPFPTLRDYFKVVIGDGPLAGTIMTVLAGFGFLSWSYLGAEYCRKPELAVRVFLLGPVALFVPFGVWMVFATLALIGDPGFNLTRSEKPAWIQAPLIAALGSWTGFWGLFALVVLFYIVAFARLRQILKQQFVVRTACAITAVAVFFVLLDIGLSHRSPSVFWPSRGTVYAKGFSNAAFSDVQPSMTLGEVEALVGLPLQRRTGEDGTVYLDFTKRRDRWWGDDFTKRRDRWWGDFEYFLRRVHLKDGRVSDIERDFTFNVVLP